MSAAHGAACGDDLAVIHIAVQRNHTGIEFAGEVIVPLFMHLHAEVGVTVGAVPAFGVDGVYAEQLQLACFNPGLCDFYHALVFPVPESAGLAGEYHHGTACMAVHLVFHITVQIFAPLFVVIDLHS